MKASLPLLFAAAIAVSACRDNSSATRRTQNYDVVQEGAASGVTSTINGPGETSTAAVNAPMTSTNADTTTAFAVSTDIVPEGAPGSVASTLTSQPVQGAMGSPVVQASPPGATQPPPIRVYVPASPRRAPAPQQQTATGPRPSRTPTDGLPPMHSSTTATEPPATETQPVTETQAAPATDRQTQAAPPENTKKKKKEEPPPPPPDDEPPPPPPSTSTSTIGPG